MAKSLALWLALVRARGPAVPTDLPPPPEGQGALVWLRPGPGAGPAGLALLAAKLRRARPDLRLMVTADPALDPGQMEGVDFPPGTLLLPAPPERTGPVAAFLDRYRPALMVFTGTALPVATLAALHDRSTPVVYADAVMTMDHWRRWRWHSSLAAALLDRCAVILVQDADSARRLRRLAGYALPIEVTGAIESALDPLPANEAEREALALLLRARPVWFAAGTTAEDEEAILAAHARASQYAHRMLLILAPADPARGPEIAAAAAARDWQVALRSRDEEPEPEVQVFVADAEGETGLWYRLAPVSFMAGTFGAGTPAARSPLEPAALGSAILHGPAHGAHSALYARLAAAGAARQVAAEEALAEALVDLIAADRAALLAHAAWSVSSGGAGAAEDVLHAVLARLPAPAGADLKGAA
ncbi:glycosyltransferase N-terminal domain-containing protein [Frigidibacter sp. MR17.14]|uniref:3-deoxy-D-manno-octulosonic acid transferase n=1 Tax=Frigidibacter sp. MR17.14 TaxID=3126509 RepID=UPI003012C174